MTDFALNFKEIAGSLAVVAAQAGESAPADAPPGGLGGMLPLFLLMGVLLWMVVLRPQKKERQKREQMLNTIGKGDRVVSIGGIHGKVVDVDENRGTITVEVAPKVPVKFSKAAIQAIEDKKSGDPAPEKDKEK